MELEKFTEKEEYWINKLLQGEELLDALDNKSDKWLTNSYLNYLDLMIKMGNLRPPRDEDEYQKLSRVVKINRVIPKEILEVGNYHYAIFNGVYLVQQVVFVKAENCQALLNKQLNDNEKLKESELLISSFKTMIFEDGSKWCIFLVKSQFTNDYIKYTETYWDYPYIYEDEE